MLEQELVSTLRRSALWSVLFGRAGRVEIGDWAVGGGALAQTVWNSRHGFADRHGIRDVDLVYFDDRDLTEEGEARVADEMRALFGDLGVALDVKNQARVHLWYERRFGNSIPPYRSLESAVATWPTTSTAIAVRLTGDGEIGLIAPFGIDDLLAGIIRPNKRQITESVYEAKIARWRPLWPKLDIRPWNEAP